MPVFSGEQWWSDTYYDSLYPNKNLYDAYSSASVYTSFDDINGMEIMNGIKVFKSPTDNKPMIAYNREIKVSNVALAGYASTQKAYTFHGLGLKKEANGHISSNGSNPILITGGYQEGADFYYNVNNVSFTNYANFLEEAGLYPSGTMLPDHSKITIEAAGSNGTNIMANGIYDFILAYYNPKSDGAVEGADLKARLPQWPASGLTLDGSANGGQCLSQGRGRRLRRTERQLRGQHHRPHGQLPQILRPHRRLQKHQHCRGWG
jgi:hypothetical protein